MSLRQKLVAVGVTLVTFGSIVLACDDDRRSGGASGDGTFNSANKTPTKQEPDSGFAKEIVDAQPPPLPTCAEYCTDYESTCGFGLEPLPAQGPDAAAVSGTNGYIDRASCLGICNALPSGDWRLGGDGFTAPEGETRLCRFAALHATSRLDAGAGPNDAGAGSNDAGDDKNERCAVAGPAGTPFNGSTAAYGACGGACESYCTLAQSLCVDAGTNDRLWEDGNSFAACMKDCQRTLFLDPSSPNAVVSNARTASLNCHLYELEVTTSDPTACASAGTRVPPDSRCVTAPPF
jgi:hypothetical protein